MTIAEALELNSDCIFCGKDKFKPVQVGNDFQLVRCTDPDCDIHCKFGHTQAVSIPDGREDTVEIASGWGSS